jgi:hypothetical protein
MGTGIRPNQRMPELLGDRTARINDAAVRADRTSRPQKRLKVLAGLGFVGVDRVGEVHG